MSSREPEIKNKIRRLRFDHGEMTQDQLGKMAGATRHTIMALEAGKYYPSLLLAFRIAHAFRVDVEQVFDTWSRQSKHWTPTLKIQDFGIITGVHIL